MTADVPLARTERRTWTFYAHVVRVVDGDTFIADLDLGLDTWRMSARVRLAHIDAPEIDTAAGVVALHALTDLLASTVVRVVSMDYQERYGRILATVTLPDGKDAGETLIAEGFARAWEGKGPKPW